jgi:hypothetical protein
MKYNNSVKRVRPLGGYRLQVVFTDGFVAEVDLRALFEHPRGPIMEPFKDPAFCQNVFLDADTVSWPNGFDICSDVLRHYCELGRVCSREELNEYFNPTSALVGAPALALHDKKP